MTNLKLWQNSNSNRTQIVTKLKLWPNSNCDKNPKIKIWKIKICQIVTKLIKSNCDKTKKLFDTLTTKMFSGQRFAILAIFSVLSYNGWSWSHQWNKNVKTPMLGLKALYKEDWIDGIDVIDVIGWIDWTKSVAKSPILKSSCPFKWALWKNYPCLLVFCFVFFCFFCLFLPFFVNISRYL